MAKMHVQKAVTVTLELTEVEVAGLKALLSRGIAQPAIIKLNLNSMAALLDGLNEIATAPIDFTAVALIK